MYQPNPVIKPLTPEMVGRIEVIKVNVIFEHHIIENSLNGVITRLREMDWTQFETQEEYIVNMYRRIFNLYGIVVAESTEPLDFINVLIKIGYIYDVQILTRTEALVTCSV